MRYWFRSSTPSPCKAETVKTFSNPGQPTRPLHNSSIVFAYTCSLSSLILYRTSSKSSYDSITVEELLLKLSSVLWRSNLHMTLNKIAMTHRKFRLHLLIWNGDTFNVIRKFLTYLFARFLKYWSTFSFFSGPFIFLIFCSSPFSLPQVSFRIKSYTRLLLGIVSSLFKTKTEGISGWRHKIDSTRLDILSLTYRLETSCTTIIRSVERQDEYGSSYNESSKSNFIFSSFVIIPGVS